MSISKCGSKQLSMFGAAAAMVVAAAIALFALAGCSGSTNSGGTDQKEETPAANALADLKAGSNVTFGSFEQDGNSSNGPEPIEWRVLSVENGEALLVSEYVLDRVPFNSSDSSGNDWETSELKLWLDGEFSAEAFDSDDRQQIIEVTCLSVEEAEDYFSSNDDRMCAPTEYAISRDVYVSKGSCAWWLRSPGAKSFLEANVDNDGYIRASGYHVNDEGISVRPALRVKL